MKNALEYGEETLFWHIPQHSEARPLVYRYGVLARTGNRKITMISTKTFAPQIAAAAAAALAIVGLVLPTIVSAQDIPSYAQPSRDESIQGRIASVNGTFNISVRDDRGFVDNVELHQGTIINPTGLTLEAGMSVTVLGVSNGGEFDANEIDTPYNYDGPLPVPVYIGPGWWYPGFAYGYGPSFGLSLFFGNGGFGFEHHRFYGRPFAYNGRGFVPSGGFVGVRAPLGGSRAIEPAGRAPQGAWRSFSTSRAGFSAPAGTTRGYSGATTRGYSGATTRGYSGATTRGYSGATTRGYSGATTRGYSGATTRGYSGGSRGSTGAARSSGRTSSPAARGGGHGH